MSEDAQILEFKPRSRISEDELLDWCASVAERVHLAIWRSGMTLQAVAELLGISRRSLSRRLSCKTDFTVFETVLISDLLAVDLKWLYAGPIA